LAAAIDRARGPRRRAAERACPPNDRRDPAERPSRRNAVRAACPRLAEGFRLDRLRRKAAAAPRRVFIFPVLGGRSLTPARRAFDSPIAIAC
jgi:hypothetical protein